MQRTEGQKPEEAEQEQPPKFPVEVAVLSLESLSFRGVRATEVLVATLEAISLSDTE